MANALLDVKNLCVDYGALPAVHDVSFTVEDAKIVGIVGESGCGKSSLVSSIVGALPANGSVTGGQALFAGNDLLAMDDRELRSLLGDRLSVVFQNPQATFTPVRTLESQFIQTIRAHRQVSKDEARSMALASLRAMDLEDPERVLKSHSFELSGGMCQRAALALAMVLKPALIIGDEPTSALDVIVQNRVIDEMKKLNEEFGTAFILISHNMGVVFHLAHEVCVMYAGRIVERASVDQIASNPLHPYTRALIASIPQIGEPELVGIPGTPPVLGQEIRGCAFADRCMHASDRCRAARPNAVEVEKGHEVACWLYAGDEEGAQA